MTEWKPEDEKMLVVARLLQQWYGEPNGDFPAHEADIIIDAVQPLIAAEERERIAMQFDDWGKRDEAAWIRSLIPVIRSLITQPDTDRSAA